MPTSNTIPADLKKMVEVFLAEQADAVFGSRFLASEYRRVLFFRHELGNRFLTLLCNMVSDLNLSDMETCYKMVRTGLLKSIPLTRRRIRNRAGDYDKAREARGTNF